jgi:uncharacterized iron-regulated membrane protein
MGFVAKPQRVWWRKVLFQVHLWVGVILGLYFIVIGISGSILVFKDELAVLSYPRLMRAKHSPASQEANLVTVMDNFRAALPTHKLVSAYTPGVFGETFFGYMEGPEESSIYIFADPSDGQVTGQVDLKTSWLFWIADLHFRLLAGQVGFIINGIGGLFLVLLCLTGIVLWWPGIKTWVRALTINFKRSWKRINFDLHSAVGFWLLAFVFMWALSGAYFVWPQKFEAFVDSFSSVQAATEPKVEVPPPVPGKTADLRAVLAQATVASPGNSLAGIYVPEDPKAAIQVFMTRGDRSNFSNADHIYFDPSSGNQLAIWRSGINPTLGSKIIFYLGPLHFGVYWGLGIKIIWAIFGLSLPLLTITGTLMYWNRSLGKYWDRLKSKRQKKVLRDPVSVTEA